jgi:radical SAM protein with 4Fe4S-binding SPASM domain
MNRTQLETVIPLRTPYTVLVDPCNLCNGGCWFCPSGDHEVIKLSGRNQRVMEMDTFRDVLAGLSCFPDKIKVLRFYKEGEPLLNLQLETMVHMAKKSKRILRVDTTTNGLLLSPARNSSLITSGIDQINISVSNIFDVDYRKNVEDLFLKSRGKCFIQTQFISENHNEVEVSFFLEVYGKISDKTLLMHLQPNWPGFMDNDLDGATLGHYGQLLNKKQVCPFIFYQMVINSDGTISACVQDWEHKLIVGTVHDGLRNAWGNLNELRMKHLKMQRDDVEVCKQCRVLEHGTLDNIDQYADELIKKI